jgi:hypothetical protein
MTTNVISQVVTIQACGQDRFNSSILTGGSAWTSAHDLLPRCLGAHRFGDGDRPRPGSCRAADEVFDQHPQRQAGLCSLRSTQRRRQLPAGAALPFAARSVPERCGRLVWRRARPCEPHAHESYRPSDSNEPCHPNEPDHANESDAPRAHESCESDESDESGH